MNEATPRRITGTLLERAAEVYDFQQHFRARGERERGEPHPGEEKSPAKLPRHPGLVPESTGVTHTQAADVDQRWMPEQVRHDGNRPVATIDRDLLARGSFLVPGAPVDVLAEEFRLVKRQILLTAQAIAEAGGARSQLVLVCSAKPSEGKTFSAINLALSMAAERDIEVLLVDADFAKPDVMRTLGLGEGPGLLDALADPAVDLESCIVPTDVPGLSLLPAGTRIHNDTELLTSRRTEALLDALVAADPRRIVVFDSPPALAASPASVLASQVGQVMMVVRADATGDTDLREAVALLDGCEHIQLVLNAVTYAPGGPRFGSYYGQEDAS